ncbi:hypothetical protein F0562_028309 [Nyssa sinensis]|uniref:STI1 domain-containing protein n=1 Tax=Nyssa sinensis TaxID=561372 RepID=A0A5J5B8C5_9ASTE|nr:hypothetical protein F0562_028309 [Nyssa sinensis]
MENLALVSSPKIVLGCSANPKDIVSSRYSFGLPSLFRKTRRSGGPTKLITSTSALSSSQVLHNLVRESFASISSSTSQETSAVGVNPQLSVPPPPSHVGSPLFWIGVGVGLSALFSWVATNLKKYAMQQAFRTLMGQMDSQNNQFDVAATKVDTPPAMDVKDDTELEEKREKYAFVDISPEETLQKSPFENFKESIGTESLNDAQFANQVSPNGAASKPGIGSSGGSSSTGEVGSVMSVEALEKMMEDPTVQKMVYPYLPEEMRNPSTFKWMLQNPQYRQQLARHAK